jgi:hypothetical protein
MPVHHSPDKVNPNPSIFEMTGDTLRWTADASYFSRPARTKPGGTSFNVLSLPGGNNPCCSDACLNTL